MSNSANTYPDPRTGTSENESSVDELFDVLSEARRRRILSILTGRQSMDVKELANAVAARENDAAPATLSESTVHEVHVTLHHVHLPKLAEATLVNYDRNDRTVAPTDATDAVSIEIE